MTDATTTPSQTSETTEATTETVAPAAETTTAAATEETETKEAAPADPLAQPSTLNDDGTPAAEEKTDETADELKVLGAPEAYELTVPEGMTLDAEALAVAEPIFRKLNLSNEAAQELVTAYPTIAQGITDRANKAVIDEIVAQRAQWAKDALADAEIGGTPEAFDGSKKLAAAGLDRLGFTKGHPFRTLLDETGLGNHPEMIRAWVRVGKAVSEDTEFHRTTAAGPQPKTIAQTFYGDTYQRKEV